MDNLSAILTQWGINACPQARMVTTPNGPSEVTGISAALTGVTQDEGVDTLNGLSSELKTTDFIAIAGGALFSDPGPDPEPDPDPMPDPPDEKVSRL